MSGSFVIDACAVLSVKGKRFYACVLMEQELKRFPTLQAEISAATGESLERFRDDSKKTVIRLVEMEASYLTVEFFRKLPQEVEKVGNPAGGNPAASTVDRYTEGHFRRIASNVSSYVNMVSDTLRNTIPKAVVHCQVREAKQSLLNLFYTQIGKKEVLSLSLSHTHTHAHTLTHQPVGTHSDSIRCISFIVIPV